MRTNPEICDGCGEKLAASPTIEHRLVPGVALEYCTSCGNVFDDLWLPAGQAVRVERIPDWVKERIEREG